MEHLSRTYHQFSEKFPVAPLKSIHGFLYPVCVKSSCDIANGCLNIRPKGFRHVVILDVLNPKPYRPNPEAQMVDPVPLRPTPGFQNPEAEALNPKS